MIRRREFIMLFGGGVAAWPLAVRAQQAAMPVVGFLGSTSPDLYAHLVAAVREGFKETGYVEGRNLAIEYRWAEEKYDRLPALATELVDRRVAVIVANTPAALAAKTATTTIPIVFSSGLDPVKAGLVTTLNRPGGNITGVSTLSGELVSKQLELVHELARKPTIVAALVNPTNLGLVENISKELQAAANTLALQLSVLFASSEREIDTAFANLLNLK